MATDTIDALVAHECVRAARHHIERSDESTLARQAALSAIPAPTGSEGARGAHVAGLFREAGLSDVAVDEVGNVTGWLGTHRAEPVVLSAHLDTVFGAGLDVSVARRGPRLAGPGISDNARGLAALVTVAEALVRSRVVTLRPVRFTATVGEEGDGNLRGVRHLFDRETRPHAFIALDGAGVERIVHRALGARRYRATYRGPGGHSWAAFGVANPANAVGRAVALIAERPTLHGARTTSAVVRIGGGTGLNSIPQEAWFDLDLRSEDPRALDQLDKTIQALLRRALAEENGRRTAGTPPLDLDLRRLGERPSGLTPRAHPLVQTAIAATRALGRSHELACASTDANVPIALGVPAIALGAGGHAGDAHLPTEWYENVDGPLGVVRALFVTAAMAGVR
jgi:acetylornithine deacetylase/succinyl-diaminopimelate desuccinylase-like protein